MDTEAKPAPTPAASRVDEHVVIRPLSDVIFLYPTLIAGIVCGAIVSFGDVKPSDPGVTGLIFTLMFFFNLSIVAFDYSRLASIALVLVAIIVGLVSALWPPLGKFLQTALDQPLFMNATFYWVWSAGLALIFILTLLRARFDYWEVKNNELLHHHGFLGDVERWSAPNMRISKEIKDVLEYALARSGRLVLVPPGESRAIVIDNVPRINDVEAKIQHLLSRLRVADGD